MLQLCFEFRIKAFQDGLPVFLAVGHKVKLFFQIRRKLGIHDRRKITHHQIIDRFPHFRGIQVFMLLGYIPAGDDRRDRGSISRRAADPLFLQSAHKGRLCVPVRGLGEMLVGFDIRQIDFRTLFKHRPLAADGVRVVILPFFIDGGKAGELFLFAAETKHRVRA